MKMPGWAGKIEQAVDLSRVAEQDKPALYFELCARLAQAERLREDFLTVRNAPRTARGSGVSHDETG